MGKKERLEAERLEKEKQDQERLEALRLQKEKEEKEQLEKERLEAERQRKVKEVKERLEKVRLEAERVAKEKEEKEQLEKERLDAERLQKEKEEKDRLEKERLDAERLQKEKEEKDRLEREKKEKEEQERLEKLKTRDRLILNNMIFIIPSWGNLLASPSNGIYVNQEVTKILTDIVIFFAGSECAVETEKGTVYYIFGLGYYYTKFEVQAKGDLSRGNYITDNRLLTTLVLSDFVYDQLAKSRKITLEDDRDVIIAEDIIKIPTDLSFKTENQQTFIKGAIMRNVFIPNKEIILNFMKEIQNPENFDLESRGHFILSAHRDNYNKILVSENLKAFLPGGYTSDTAGITEIIGGADELMTKTLSPVELGKIRELIPQLKRIYSTLQFDPIYPYSILENVSMVLKSETIPISMREGIKKGLLQKESVLFSAEPNITKMVSWPKEIERVERVKEIKVVAQPPKEFYAKPEPKISASSAVNNAARESILKNYREPLKDEEKFVLRTVKSETVATKPLPTPPAGDIEEIFLYVKYVIEENFDMRSFSKACGLARDNLRKILLQSDFMWELSKWERLYQTKPANLTLPPKDVKELLEKLDKEIQGIQEKKRKEREEKERLEREEKERQERERERQEQMKRERERLERERIEQEKIVKEKQRLEEDQKERQRLEALRKEQAKIQQERERQRLEHERQEQERLEQERLAKEREELEALAREKEELAQMKQERKEKEKVEKQRQKQDKKLEKQKAKVAKQKEKEQARLDKIQ